jgi:hypothetical protein
VVLSRIRWLAWIRAILCVEVHHRDQRYIPLLFTCRAPADGLASGRTLEETAALFDGEPVELMEAGGEAATHHTARYFVGRDSNEDSGSGADSKRPPSAEHKEDPDLSMYEDIEMHSVSVANTDSRGEIREVRSITSTLQEPTPGRTITRKVNRDSIAQNMKRDSYP